MDWYFAPWQDMWRTTVGKIFIASFLWLMVLNGMVSALNWILKGISRATRKNNR